MDTRTHERFAQGLFKSMGVPVNNKLVRQINWDIDNSPGYVVAMGQFLKRQQKLIQGGGNGTKFMGKSPQDMFGIMSGGHRSFGHDLLSGLMIGAKNARSFGLPASRGMLPVFAHYAADSMSNRLVTKMGVDGRNLFQAMFNYQTRKR